MAKGDFNLTANPPASSRLRLRLRLRLCLLLSLSLRLSSAKPLPLVIMDEKKQEGDEDDEDKQYVVEEAAPPPADAPELDVVSIVISRPLRQMFVWFFFQGKLSVGALQDGCTIFH